MDTHWRKLAVVLIGLSVVASAAPPTGDGIRTKELKSLAARLNTQADKWAKDKLDDEQALALGKELKAVTYDLKSVPALGAQLSLTGRRGPTPAALYVVNRLVKPLLLAKTDVIRKALPTVRRTYARVGRYYVYPEAPSGQPAGGSLPEFRGKASPDAMMAALARHQADGEKRVVTNKLYLKRNQQVHALTVALFELMLLADEAKLDEALIRELAIQEAKGNWAYVDIAEAVGRGARRLSPKRAEVFYNALRAYAGQVRLKRGNYLKPFDTVITATGQATQASGREYPVIRLLNTVNLLAPVAAKPAVSVPTTRQVAKQISDQAARARLQRQQQRNRR